MIKKTPGAEILRTTCPLDCPDVCSLEIERTDGRVTRLDGAASDAFTDGFICGKVRRFADHVYGEDRLLSPLKRVGVKGAGEFRPVSWDEALTTIATRLLHDRQTHGGESILPLCYGGANGKLTQDSVDMRMFYRLGASLLDRTVCAAPSSAAFQALYGKMPGVSLSDYVHSKLIIVWGNNPHASGIHLVPIIQRAQRNGARLVVIDPRTTQLAQVADLHLPILPGSDLPIALAMIHWLLSNGHAESEFIESHTYGLDRLADRAAEWTLERAADVAAISVDRLRQLLRWYVELNPAVIRCGWGPERNRNGGSAIAAILAIPAIANKFGRRGGGFTMSNSGAWKLDAASSIQAARPDTRHINMNRVGESLLHLTDPPITSLFVYNCNPLATLPEQNKVLSGLQREDLFTVVFDQAMTDTATYADIVLPATTFLEHHDLRNGYGYPKMGEVKPVITPVGEARPNYEVFADLVKRMGLARPDDVVDAEGLKRAVLGDTRLRQLKPTGGMEPEGGFHPVQMVDALPLTPSGRIELYPRQLAEHDDAQWYVHLPDPKTAEFPLALLSPSSSRTVNSTLGQLLDKPAAILLNPYDADQRGLAEGQTVRVHNASGEVVVDLKVDNRVRPGVAELPKGLWRRHTKNGQTANALAPDTLSHVGQGACFNDARVEVSAL